jgi:hypothetical protein
MADTPVLFWTKEPKYGCSQPVREGDLLRVKDLGYGWKWEGRIVMVLGTVDPAYTKFVPEYPDDLFPADDPEECFVIIDGRRDTVRIEYLEAIVD